MSWQNIVDNSFNHWTRKLSAMILTYIGIITLVIKFIYPSLEGIYPSMWTKLQYSLTVLLTYILGISIYVKLIFSKNKMTSINSLLDIFPTYATFVRVLAGLILVITALFIPNLRVLAITYVTIIVLVGALSLFRAHK